MPIPSFQRIMLPLLRSCADGRDYRFPEIRDPLADEFELTPSERSELLASGVQSRFDNRVRWARTHLGKAGLLDTPARGVFRITDRGRQLLESAPEGISMASLLGFPEYAAWRGVEPVDGGDVDAEQTPQEIIDRHYRGLRRDLEDSLLARVKGASPQFFEQLVVALLVKMGYGGTREDAAAAVGGTGDGGIDGVINEDPLGLDTVYIQAKRWEGNVGRPVIQGFAGALEGQRARKGVFITTSAFSPEARDYVSQIEKRIVLIDGGELARLMVEGGELARLMVEHGVGVRSVETYVLNDIDEEFFGDEVAASGGM